MKWKTKGFEEFSKGAFGNGGQNLYVSHKGILQRIRHYDVNLDGYPDLLFANSHGMDERPPIYIYENLPKSEVFRELPSNGTFDGILTDLTGDGYDDLVIACQNNGTLQDITAILYFGSKDGLQEEYRMELPAPDAVGVAAGDFNGNGKKDLAFLSEGRLRVFYQQETGFAAAIFTDYDITMQSVCPADVDGDGYCDLYFKTEDGRAGILFGGKQGLDLETVTWISNGPGKQTKEPLLERSTTAGRKPAYLGWNVNVLTIGGREYLFHTTGKKSSLYQCDQERNIRLAWEFNCANSVAAMAGDLTGNGVEDIVFAAFTGRNAVENCTVYLGNGDGFSEDRVTYIPVMGAKNLCIMPLEAEQNYLIICCCGGEDQLTVESPVYVLDHIGNATQKACVKSGDCMRIVSGYTSDAATPQVIVLNHEMNRPRGDENIVIFLGGKDGYDANRRIDLPGWAAVQGIMCDFSDNGAVDVLVCNCFENAPHLDEGSYIYINEGTGLSDKNKWIVPTVRCHGAAVGDFRKLGYLDIACGGYSNRELRIFHGGENGYSRENSTSIVFGPDDGTYTPVKMKNISDNNNRSLMSPEEWVLQAEYGQLRFLFTADFNGNGWLDLFVSEIGGPVSYILWGGPDGFSKQNMSELLVDGACAANAADLTDNGYLDLIVAQHKSIKKNNQYESYLHIYWGGPEGYREDRKMQLPVSCANSVTVGDYNGNGSFDLYSTSYNDGRKRDLLSYLYKGDKGRFSMGNVQYLFNHSGSGCMSGDLNGNGYTDLVVASHKEYGSHQTHSFVYWGGPNGIDEARKTPLPTVGPHGMVGVDPGNIMDRGDAEYYTSPIKELSQGTVVQSIQYVGECSANSWVQLAMRGADAEELVEFQKWQDVEVGVDISARKFGGFVQYRVALCAKCGCGTPRIREITVNY